MPRRKNTIPVKKDVPETETFFANPRDSSASGPCDSGLLVQPLAADSKKSEKKRRSHVSPQVRNKLSQFDFHLPIVEPTKAIGRGKVEARSLFRLGGVTFTASAYVNGNLASLNSSDNSLYVGYLGDKESFELLWCDCSEVAVLEASCSIPTDVLRLLTKPSTFYLTLKSIKDACVEVDVRLSSSQAYRPLSAGDAARTSVSEGMRQVVQHFLQLPHPRRCPEEKKSSRHDREILYERIRRMQQGQETPLQELDVTHPNLKPLLRPYQVDAVRWMVHRERRDLQSDAQNFLYVQLFDSEGNSLWYSTHCGFFVSECLDFAAANQRGGILADEMGLGKTVELLACILMNPMPEKSPIVDTCRDVTESSGALSTTLSAENESFLFECFCGEFGDSEDIEELVQCCQCGVFQHAACTAAAAAAAEDYLCPHCWVDPKKEPLKTKATLIICPASICFQWQEEIEKHLTSAAVLVYEGVHKQGFISPATLAKYDIVLVTYDVLGKEIYLVDFPLRNDSARWMRRRKKFVHAPSPLPAVVWWRVCLDEAQMVESTTTKCAQMAVKLSAVNRWCITGTPIQKGLKDLYGLLLFLGEEPYNVELWWNELLLGPYCDGRTEPLVSVLSKCFRRTMKKDVLDQIGVPPQESVFHELSFSAVEEVFYKRQAQACAAALETELRKYRDVNTKLGRLDPHSVTLLVKPLTSLRQACCHPQAVRGKFLPLRTDSLTLDELLTCLIKKTTTECEEAHRLMIAAMNGLAGIHTIRNELQDAAELYRQVLWSAKDHSKDIKTDKLQRLHAVHNLAQLLESCNKGTENAISSKSDVSLNKLQCLSKEHKASNLQEDWSDSDTSFDSESCSDTLTEDMPFGLGKEGVCSESTLNGSPSASSTESSTVTEPQLSATDGLLSKPQIMSPASDDSLKNEPLSLPSSGLTFLLGTNGLTTARHESSRNDSLIADGRQSLGEPQSSVCIARAPNDDELWQEAAKLRKAYLDKYASRIRPCRSEMKHLFRVVKEKMGKFSLPSSNPWWNVLLDASIERGKDDWLVDRVKTDLENKKSSVINVLKDRFTNAHGLQFVLQRELTKLQDSRKALQRDCRGLKPQPSAQDVASAVDCHLRPRKGKRNKCIYCKCHESFNVYESHLFCFDETLGHEEQQDKDLALLLKTRRGNWGDSELEKMVRCLGRHASVAGDKVVSADASLHLQLFASLKNEFRAMRAYYMQVCDFVAALDELEMATVRLEVQPEEARSREEEKPVNVLRPWEVESQKCKLLAEHQFHARDLRRKLGQLFYLRNLEKGNNMGSGSSNPEPCPVCHAALGEKWSVLQCGHAFCIGCIQMMLSTPRLSHGGSVSCAICRAACAHNEVFYVDMRSKQNSDPDIEVKGNYSTKVEAIVRTLLRIRRDDPSAKSIVFSKWQAVIEILKKALEDNSVPFVTVAHRSTAKNNLALFRHDPDICVLLMPLNLGAKGLNIVEATNVLLVEPLLNLGEELQAIGRVHRIGQTRKTYVHRFMVRATIEERIVEYMKNTPSYEDGVKEQSAMTIGDLHKLFD